MVSISIIILIVPLTEHDINKGWRGSVKSRHFVLALRDYYHDLEEEMRRKGASFEAASTSNPNAWALEYLNIKRLQQIADIFDEDASGFITVAEANKLTAARPLDWRYVLGRLVSEHVFSLLTT